jgi:IS1 family transposase
MANLLPKDKQIAIIAALAEGSSIRSIERMTGIHRDTIMRLGVRIGQGCAKVLDQKMRGLDCKRLELDEIWGYVGKKMRHVKEDDDPTLGEVWTYCAIDADTKLVPTFHVSSRRNRENTVAFLSDLASRLNNRVQISTDAMNSYEDAIEAAFGRDVDYAQIVKSYASEDGKYNPERRYSAPRISSSHKNWIMGTPDPALVSTSYVERLNASTRLHVKRLSRLTLAFSKKKENFEAAVALHFASYNFVKTHERSR